MQYNANSPRRRPQPVTSSVELPLDYPCQIYPRVSTPEQKNNVSTEMQKDKSFAISCGWTEEHIILDDRDLGVSGQLRMEERLAFNDMLRRIANGHIKAVVAVNVDRLFRNKWGDESGKFMEICFRYGVIVITPDFVYDFRISWHIERFKRRCEEAWNYLEYHVYGRLHPAQDERGYAGFWAGGHLPLGYIVDTREKIEGKRNPTYHRYIPYWPHAEVIAWLFRRFKQLNGVVRALVREIESKPFLFPDFDETVAPSLLSSFSQCTKVPGGYTIVSNIGLRKILKNRVYIGYWEYKGELVSTQNHEPIVTLDDFTYAYHRLSQINLDGTPNEAVLENGKHYIKRHFADRPALLKECIASEDPAIKIYARERMKNDGVHTFYGFFPNASGRVRANSSYRIPAQEFDRLILAKLREHMCTPQTASDFQNFTAVESEVVKEASATLRDIERDMTAIKSLIERILAQIRSGKLTDPDLAEAANESYTKAKAELQRLEERKTQTTVIAQEDEERRTYHALMQEVGEAWEEIVLPEEHPRLVHLFIKTVTLAIVSPLFFKATIQWHDPTWEADSGLFYKGTYARLSWTQEEADILVQHYPSATRQELMKLLPRRSGKAMKDYVGEHHLPLTRQGKKEDGVPYYVSLEDWNVMEQFGISEETLLCWDNVKLIAWACGRSLSYQPLAAPHPTKMRPYTYLCVPGR